MIYFIAILAAFFGGLVWRAIARGSPQHRMLAFIVPVCVSTGLLHLPFLFETLCAGFPPLDWETLTKWYITQCLFFLLATFATAAGWLCSYCIQTIFED